MWKRIEMSGNNVYLNVITDDIEYEVVYELLKRMETWKWQDLKRYVNELKPGDKELLREKADKFWVLRHKNGKTYYKNLINDRKK